MTIYFVVAGLLAVIGFVIWLASSFRKAGQNAVVVDAQKEVIDGQADIQAARVATADPGSDRAERVRDRFTRK